MERAKRLSRNSLGKLRIRVDVRVGYLSRDGTQKLSVAKCLNISAIFQWNKMEQSRCFWNTVATPHWESPSAQQAPVESRAEMLPLERLAEPESGAPRGPGGKPHHFPRLTRTSG